MVKEGPNNQGLIGLMRRHQWKLSSEQQANLMSYFDDFPVLKAVYEMKQKLMKFILLKTLTARRTREQLPHYFELLDQLKNSPLRTLTNRYY